ncbi:MAG TPA: hypothetical protein VKR06_16990 [Ktedonosporobacter sp.]|nr:hypothetical protein [Ktedonosporobacter sp.]
MKPQAEVLITLRVTPNEVIALNSAIGYFLRHCKGVSPVYKQASQFLDQFQHRLNDEITNSTAQRGQDGKSKEQP